MMWKISIIQFIWGATIIALISPNTQAEDHRKKFKILVVDDEDSIRKFFTTVLRMRGHEIVDARDGEEALELFQQATTDRKPFDLVLSDLQMPRMEGNELRRALPNVFFIVHSGRPDLLRERVTADETTVLIDKPALPNAYFDAIARYEKYRASHPLEQGPQPGVNCPSILGGIQPL